MDMALLFGAGRVAAARGWQSPEIVAVEQADTVAAVGGPVILISPPGGITSTHARTVATLVGAGREVLLIGAGDVDPDCAAWLPPGVLHGTEAPEATDFTHEPDTVAATGSFDISWEDLSSTHPGPAPSPSSTAAPTFADSEFERQCRVAAEAWLVLRDTREWPELPAHGDVGFPLAYCVAHGTTR